jgi:hypothetical protein
MTALLVTTISAVLAASTCIEPSQSEERQVVLVLRHGAELRNDHRQLLDPATPKASFEELRDRQDLTTLETDDGILVLAPADGGFASRPRRARWAPQFVQDMLNGSEPYVRTSSLPPAMRESVHELLRQTGLDPGEDWPVSLLVEVTAAFGDGQKVRGVAKSKRISSEQEREMEALAREGLERPRLPPPPNAVIRGPESSPSPRGYTFIVSPNLTTREAEAIAQAARTYAVYVEELEHQIDVAMQRITGDALNRYPDLLNGNDIALAERGDAPAWAQAGLTARFHGEEFLAQSQFTALYVKVAIVFPSEANVWTSYSLGHRRIGPPGR